MELLSKAVPITMLAFVVSSMLAVGLSLTIRQIVAPLRNGKLVFLALLANFVLMPLGALAIARILRLDQPLGIALLLLGAAAGAPFLPKLAGIAKGNLAFAVGLMVLLMVLTVAYMPLVLPLLLEGVSVDPMKIARSLVLLMLLPLGAGLAVNARFGSIAERMRAPLNRISSSQPGTPDRAAVGDEHSKCNLLVRNTRHFGEHPLSFRRCWNRVAPRRSGPRDKGRAGVSDCTAQYCRCTCGWRQGLRRPQSTRHDCRRCRRRAAYSHAAGACLWNSKCGNSGLEHHRFGTAEFPHIWNNP